MTGTLDNTKFDRADLLTNSVDILRKMERRLNCARWKAKEGDHDFLAYVRAYAQLLMVVNGIAKDIEIEELQQEIEQIKEQQH